MNRSAFLMLSDFNNSATTYLLTEIKLNISTTEAIFLMVKIGWWYFGLFLASALMMTNCSITLKSYLNEDLAFRYLKRLGHLALIGKQEGFK